MINVENYIKILIKKRGITPKQLVEMYHEKGFTMDLAQLYGVLNGRTCRMTQNSLRKMEIVLDLEENSLVNLLEVKPLTKRYKDNVKRYDI